MRNKFILCVLIPLLILVGMTIKPLYTLYYGQEIKLKTQPVDPTDLFRGDYVILDYEIRDLKISQCPELEQVKDKLVDSQFEDQYRNKSIYVSLKPENGVYVIETASFQKPSSGIYLTGKLRYFEDKPELPPPGEQTGSEPNNTVGPTKPDKEEAYKVDTARVDYQLDKYFVPENTGLELEELSRKGQLIATVKTYQGSALVVGVEQAPAEK